MRIYATFLIFFLCGSFLATAQYTETINSNRPGNSQGAFAVGPNVLQLEAGGKFGNDDHELLQTETELWGVDYALRFGLFFEELEINLMGSFLDQTTSYMVGAETQNYGISNFDSNTIGVKYLIYDPNKNAKAKKPNLYSWKANQRFDWSIFIPAVAVYGGANFSFGDNPYLYEGQGKFSPRAAVITQNNWGPWVLVLNVIGDQIGEEFPTYSGIATLTHSFSKKFAMFGEFQTIISDIYSDEIARGGLAYLFHKNFQADISGLINFKDTPSRWQVAGGLSYRFDWHKQDQYLEAQEEL
ncbi:transporter [Salinimicrobium sp. TH3]|uniref:transporter n=1 Tax=Salinimicrobium sp. TH3 TaxID=2997342 RepID=UPI002273AC42|nr:transporter [Salinimicrobium sp. TH3]MCY2687260.1 transporter [Salinimicrobium sp. TH3]